MKKALPKLALAMSYVYEIKGRELPKSRIIRGPHKI